MVFGWGGGEEVFWLGVGRSVFSWGGRRGRKFMGFHFRAQPSGILGMGVAFF